MGNEFPLCIAKKCACFHLFVKKHISLPFIASDGVVCLAKKQSLIYDSLKAKWGTTLQRRRILRHSLSFRTKADNTEKQPNRFG